MGTTMDLRSYGGPAPWDVTDWATSKAGKWLGANAWKYGFILSYPKGKTSLTCYMYEPWHFRYIGADAGQARPRQWPDAARVPLARTAPLTRRGRTAGQPPSASRSR